MGGIYIHIPFCKQACYYCDFHFSTSTGKKEEMIRALQKELQLRKEEFRDEKVETIYFGGGTPSLLSAGELSQLINTVYTHYRVDENPEITVEANPDDLSAKKIEELAASPVNRLSIGIQSFFDTDLKWMNRAHNANEARKCLSGATRYFDNMTIDLIYGIPGMDNSRWMENLARALEYQIPHISAYALTVEPKTALEKFIRVGKADAPNEAQAGEQFAILAETLQSDGFVHYELSNFGKEGYFSRNNTAYWLGKKYLGIGPSAHSYDGRGRSWNIANNARYIKAINREELPRETEILTETDRYNEYVMTGLRTIWGISPARVEKDFGPEYSRYLLKQAGKHIENGMLSLDEHVLLTTSKGKFLADGIAADLFFVK
ncbi:radical SAM family heme chaperone HemW [Sinomicrobium weinanense]|uniref:Heme chaperone HemW n=1 Tax=Sinomicrobium weinanense TaxID=2842200 RepID=A0A926Q4W9_9FLAO|nr:radical SAM family heme chaperone HemW [Sinomicrobium weinanense]MBC9798444.1 radical SAM family heme chaperone HemW [Sinomicrobium weinanense]MBU3125196.1 radical SAM family heme chaperone HemW [Sinomicrobium weinanense]